MKRKNHTLSIIWLILSSLGATSSKASVIESISKSSSNSIISMTTTPTTTEIVVGVWKRLWEEDPIGDAEGADRDTLVLWTQSPKSGIYVDLRLPAGVPGRSLEAAQAAGFSLMPSALEARKFSQPTIVSKTMADLFFRQKSFAGVLTYSPGDTTSSGDALKQDEILVQLAKNAADDTNDALPLCTCFWRRDIDYQPPTGGLDIGVCASEPSNEDGSIDLRETGADGSYAEGWHRLPGTSQKPFLAMKLLSENNINYGREGYWVRVGTNFAYAVGRPKNVESAKTFSCHEKSMNIKEECVGKSLSDAVRSLVEAQTDDDNNLQEQLQIVGSYVVVHGEVSNDDSSWTIMHSTDPGLVGCTLAGTEISESCCSKLKNESRKESSSVIETGDIIIQEIAGEGGVLRKWEVVEVDGDVQLPLP